ncbi:hypothetical protein BX600DRAFT_378444 [Xylariales sp. PMI_506]|nr:hypothetical protein BX600DRAFT_378444 [Xylariales sp. PMI_506]
MIANKTWPQYILVRAVIVLMRDLWLLCFLYFFTVFALGGVVAIAHPISIFIEIIGLIELLFLLLFFLPYRSFLQKWQPYKPPPLSPPERARLFAKALSLVPDGELFVRKWMLNVPLEEVRRENVKDWLMWALFERDSSGGYVGAEVDAELEQYLEEIEERLGLHFEPGRNDVEVLRLSFDPVIIQHRSLLFYSMIGLLDTLMTFYQLATGWKYYRQPASTLFKVFPIRLTNLLPFTPSAAPGMSYWYRPHKSKTQRPVVFIHGLGIGLIPYMFWLRTLPPDVGVLAVEMLPISGRVTSYPLAATPELGNMIAACIAQQRALQNDGSWDDFVLIGNSYGTLLMNTLLQNREVAPRVAACVLIDPVSLLLHLPDVAYNFTRRSPRRSRHGRPGHANEWQIWWASATDAGTAHALARRLCWRESLLWRETLTPSMDDDEMRAGMRTTVVLGSEDCVTNPKAVASYVYSGDVQWTPADVEAWKRYQWTGREELELLYLHGKDHGQGIMVPRPDPAIAKVIDQYCKRNPGSGGIRRESVISVSAFVEVE